MITIVSLVILCHHTRIHSYWLHSHNVYFIPVTHLFCNWKFVPLNFPHLFLFPLNGKIQWAGLFGVSISDAKNTARNRGRPPEGMNEWVIEWMFAETYASSSASVWWAGKNKKSRERPLRTKDCILLTHQKPHMIGHPTYRRHGIYFRIIWREKCKC